MLRAMPAKRAVASSGSALLNACSWLPAPADGRGIRALYWGDGPVLYSGKGPGACKALSAKQDGAQAPQQTRRPGQPEGEHEGPGEVSDVAGYPRPDGLA